MWCTVRDALCSETVFGWRQMLPRRKCYGQRWLAWFGRAAIIAAMAAIVWHFDGGRMHGAFYTLWSTSKPYTLYNIKGSLGQRH
jgi:hypothetical protein